MYENRKPLSNFFIFYCCGTQWEKSWDEEYRGECPVGIEIQVKNFNCSKQKEIEQQEYTCPFWLPLSIRKRKQGNRKKQGKAKGVTKQYFIQTIPWIKILCIERSKVQFMYSFSLEKRQTSLNSGEYGLINHFSSTFCASHRGGCFKGPFCRLYSCKCKTRLSNP